MSGVRYALILGHQVNGACNNQERTCVDKEKFDKVSLDSRGQDGLNPKSHSQLRGIAGFYYKVMVN